MSVVAILTGFALEFTVVSLIHVCGSPRAIHSLDHTAWGAALCIASYFLGSLIVIGRPARVRRRERP